MCKVYELTGLLLIYNLELGLLEGRDSKVRLAFSKPVRFACRNEATAVQHPRSGLQRTPDLPTLLGIAHPVTS